MFALLIAVIRAIDNNPQRSTHYNNRRVSIVKKSTLGKLGLATAAGLLATAANAHFKLNEPASWIVEDERGDPQKIAPCGGTIADGGTRTGLVTDVTGGEMLRIAIEETIYHPGHYRVSLARRINWLPEDTVPTMKDTDRGPRSDRFEIDENPQAPVLVDGLWENYERRTGPQETEVRIPNIDCEGCFLQVVQFMSDHPGFGEGGFTYHHCAMLNITADPELPMDRGW
ncbi:MAG: hypothetical protein CMP91_12960 [Gammaproteobacteria bacterium]|nr:hypothetical protein [Gammaproteobacteria bacterium]MAY01692.1 hypothetical protein [Gammaproteobacteria bacterium]